LPASVFIAKMGFETASTVLKIWGTFGHDSGFFLIQEYGEELVRGFQYAHKA